MILFSFPAPDFKLFEIKGWVIDILMFCMTTKKNRAGCVIGI